MNLHRAGKRPDWLQIKAEKRNIWQRVAYLTQGFITPGNIISICGAGLVAFGLVQIYHGELASGLPALLLGRAADVLDGIAASRTGTKSPLGEITDASLDKLAMVAALIVFVHADIVPLIPLLLIGTLNVMAIGLSVLARLHHLEFHASFSGKVSTGLYWSAFLLYVGAELLRVHDAGFLAGLVSGLALLTVVMSLPIGIFAISRYIRAATNSVSR